MLASVSQTDLNVAIVGLRPAERLEITPEGARPAEFSAGPQPSPGGEAPSTQALLSVPGLTVSNAAERADHPAAVLPARAAPTSEEALAAAARAVPQAPLITQSGVTALRVPQAPHHSLEGRPVYSLAVQMPNVTSYFGSWILWFAEREAQGGGALKPPVPLRKVDPRYVASAVAEKVEGTVQLAAVILKDGSIAAISVVRALDPRLDFAASEAFSKWIFEPALRDGSPIDVDAIIEVPFRLAPAEMRYK
jgi:TonB family protein